MGVPVFLSRVLVTGATGALGPSIVAALHQGGYAVRTLALGSAPADLLPAAVERYTGDITDRSTVEAAVEGVEAVVHMAALLHVLNPSSALRSQYERINVQGTRNVVDAARRAGVRRLVFFSTIAVYGPGHGRLLDETTSPCPDSFYAQTKLAAEPFVLDALGADRRPIGVVLRLAAVYGARIKGNYQRLVQALARHRFVPIGRGENRRTLIYDHDVARAVLVALQHPAAAGRLYNLTDGQVYPLQAIIRAICVALGQPAPRLRLPGTPTRLAAGLVEDLAHLLQRPVPIGRATIDKYLEDVAVDGRRICTELGFQPAYNLATGWQATIRAMREHGDL